MEKPFSSATHVTSFQNLFGNDFFKSRRAIAMGSMGGESEDLSEDEFIIVSVEVHMMF